MKILHHTQVHQFKVEMCSHDFDFPAEPCKEEWAGKNVQSVPSSSPEGSLLPVKPRVPEGLLLGSWRRVCPQLVPVWETMCSSVVSLNLVPGMLQQVERLSYALSV
jgi:hypothetical protein